MHGPTFMGNPLACAVATESLALLERVANAGGAIESSSREPPPADAPLVAVSACCHRRRRDALPGESWRCSSAFSLSSVWIRPFGRLIYLMPPYPISPQQLTRLTRAVCLAVEQEAFFIQ
jgi:adenosylmethionine-8-amino-7-oxononanoate aminotransferase